MGRNTRRVTQARLDLLTDRVGSRRATSPRIGDLPHGHEIARQLAVVLALRNSTDPEDRERLLLASERAGALLQEGGAARSDLLDYIAQQEDATDNHDPGIWAEVGGRPEHYSLKDPIYWQLRHAREQAARRDRQKGMRMPAAWLAAMDELSDRFGLPKTQR